MNLGPIVGFTNQGNRVFKTETDGIYLIEGNIESQFWYRTYAECYTWVEFSRIKTRAEHKELLKVER